MRKIFIIACEASGDTHGAHLAEELKKQHPGVTLRGIGGPHMAEAGVEILEDMTKISALGLGDVLRQYFKYRKIFYETLSAVEKFKPDALVLIDSPAFNLRFAKKIRKRFPVFYYIAPQIWAWGGQRIHVIKKTVSKMLVILPFEKTIYEKAGVPVEFVGHPLLDQPPPAGSREELRARFEILTNETAVGILPGSRKREVERILPGMLEAAKLIKEQMPSAVFFLVQSPNVPAALYEEILKANPAVAVRRLMNHEGLFRDVVTAMDFALITSGTATLEAGLLGTPFFLLYKASWTTYVVGKQLVKVPFLGLVNLLAGKSIVPEFIQELNAPLMAREAVILLKNPEAAQVMKNAFEEIKRKLGGPGASARTAKIILESIK